MRITLLFLFFLFMQSIFAQQSVSGSFVLEDSTRTYTIYIPQVYLDNPSTEVPLLLNLHGYGSVNWQQMFYGDFRPIADVENFIVCHPNGTVDATGSRFWNVGFTNSTIDDVSFLSALIDTISTKYNIDTDKVFSTGMSNGGFMSYKLACELPNKIKAVASVTGSMTPSQYNNCPNMNAIPAMQIHGTADPTVPYTGNATMKPIEQVVGFWVKQNGCDSVATETAVPNHNTADNSTAIRYDFNTNCSNETSVVFYKVDNGGHTWPGTSVIIPGAVTNLDFDASAVIWKFFYPQSKYTSIDPVLQEPEIKVYPNPSKKHFTLKLKDEEKLIDFKMYSQTGKLVLESDKLFYNIEALNTGIYYLKIKTDKTVYAKQILKL